MRTIVISAVNIRKGGTLTILRLCLEQFSRLAARGGYRIIAIVHQRALAEYPHIEYIEMPDVTKSWLRRLWCEYVTMHQISKRLAPVDLWLSLHDTTPRVMAKKQAVYCQTSFPFLKLRWRDLLFDYKIVLFSLFTRFAYLINIKRNSYLIVQADWLRKGFSKMFGLPQERFIVSPPELSPNPAVRETIQKNKQCQFIYVSTPDCHKNFEVICQAAEELEQEVGEGLFSVLLTINGTENRYARWLLKNWGHVKSLRFAGFLKREELNTCYAQSDCLIFPSRVETWGLPISEYAAFRKPMLLADLPYAHETASGVNQVAFFRHDDVSDLKAKMKKILFRDYSDLKYVPRQDAKPFVANGWSALLNLLLE